MKAQSSLEYLLIMVVVLIIVAIVSYLVVAGSDPSISSGERAACEATASSCKLKVLAGETCINECKKSCLNVENMDYITGMEGCIAGTGCYACANGLELPE